MFSIFSLLTGGKSYRDVHRFIKAKRTKLNKLFALGWKKAPSKSMLAEILPSLSTQAVEQAFRQYAVFLSNTDNVFSHGIDGKVLKHSFDNAKSQGMLHLLSIFCVENKLIMGHVDIDDKSNEIPAAQEVIKVLGLPEGSVYTLDALHCQKKPLKRLQRLRVN